MKRGKLVFALTSVGAIGLLALAVWPGLTSIFVFGLPQGLISLPIVGFWFFLLVGLALRDVLVPSDGSVRQTKWGVWSAAVMFGTLALLWLHVPQRIVFAFCSSELNALVEKAPDGAVYDDNLQRQVGPYFVGRYAGDKRGGVYFRTATGRDGIGPDQVSFGFAFRPNAEGTPFGNAGYFRKHLFGDWYTFSVSNDW